MSHSVTIGVWIERESRRESRCPSYYAADYEVLETQVGRYPVRLTFEGGYTIPWPYWLLIGIKATRIAGALYSGFGGVNFGSTPLPLEATTLPLQLYAYQLRTLVAYGTIELAPGFDWLLSERPWEQPAAPKTWADVRALDEHAQ